MFNGKMKAITFSYDDCTTQDVRLVKLLNKYGMKATFNVNSGLLGTANSLWRDEKTIAHCKLSAKEIVDVYKGHEVAGYTLTHPFLPSITDDNEITIQVEEDRLALSEIMGYEVVGFAYAGGGKNYSEHIADVIKNTTGVKYCRTIECNNSFDIQDDLYTFKPTAFHIDFPRLNRLANDFINLKTDTPQIFYIWGHSFEFDINDTWDEFEEFLKLIAFKEDIFYGTNKEVLL